MPFTDDEDRIILFKEPIPNKVMEGHVIRSEVVPNEGSCRLLCYMEPDCVSINVGPIGGGNYKCELNNATDENQLTFIEETATFLAIEVNYLLENETIQQTSLIMPPSRETAIILKKLDFRRAKFSVLFKNLPQGN